MDAILKLGLLGCPCLLFGLLTITIDSLFGVGLIGYMFVMVILINRGVLDDEIANYNMEKDNE